MMAEKNGRREESLENHTLFCLFLVASCKDINPVCAKSYGKNMRGWIQCLLSRGIYYFLLRSGSGSRKPISPFSNFRE
jgi:hypothetical protein